MQSLRGNGNWSCAHSSSPIKSHSATFPLRQRRSTSFATPGRVQDTATGRQEVSVGSTWAERVSGANHLAAHILLHEISHLDEFGKSAGFPELMMAATDQIRAYTAHGTVDWRLSSTAANARILTNAQAGDSIPRWRNAESLAAFALGTYMTPPGEKSRRTNTPLTEMNVLDLCKVDDVAL